MPKKQMPPLCVAAMTGNLKALQDLVNNGVDVNGADPGGRTALMNAVIESQAACAAALIAKGADVNRSDDEGWTALHFSAQNNNAELVAMLISAGADPNSQDANGNTPLFRAVFAYRNGPEFVTSLLKAGADPDTENAHRVSARGLAATIANYDARKLIPA